MHYHAGYRIREFRRIVQVVRQAVNAVVWNAKYVDQWMHNCDQLCHPFPVEVTQIRERQRRNSVTAEGTGRSLSYGDIVKNLLALRDEVQETSHEEAMAIERIVSDVMALQLHHSYISQMSIAGTIN